MKYKYPEQAINENKIETNKNKNCFKKPIKLKDS